MTQPIPKGFRTVTPHLTCKDAAKAIEFYKSALGAEETLRHEMGGQIGHAQIKVGDSMVMLNDEFPQQGAFAPPPQGSGVTVHLYLENADEAFERAVNAGCEVLFPIDDTFWGDRYGMVKDPYGHRWSFATRLEDVAPEEVERRAAQMFSGGEGSG